MIYFYIENENGDIVWSNLTDGSLNIEKKIFQNRNNNKLNTVLLKGMNGYYLYMRFDKNNISKAEYKRHKEICQFYIEAIGKLEELIVMRENVNHNVFKHNMTNYNAFMLQSLYNIIPYDRIPGHNIIDQKEYIKQSIEQNIDRVSDSFMNLIRFSRFINFEIDIYSFIQGSSFEIEMQKHSVHKLLTLILQLFLVPFSEKKITVDLDKCERVVVANYRTITIALYNILHNFGKYVRPNSTIEIKFLENSQYTEIVFHMMSLKIEENEINSIFDKGVVGKWAKASKKDGTGVGMYMAREMIVLNGGDIFFKVKDKGNSYHEDFPYQYNILEIKLKNAVGNEI